MGLAGNETCHRGYRQYSRFYSRREERERLLLAQGRHEVDFPRDNGMRFHNGNLPLHENGMQIHAYNGDEVVYSKTYYSIGGGFIVDEEHFGQDAANEVSVPYPFKSATELLAYCNETGFRCLVSLCKTNWRCTARRDRRVFRACLANHAGMYRSRDEYRRRTAGPVARATSCVGPAPDAGFQR